MKTIILTGLLLASVGTAAQEKMYAEVGAGVISRKKDADFNIHVAAGYRIKNNYFVEANSIYGFIGDHNLSVTSAVFGIKNPGERRVKLSAFSGPGISFYDGHGAFNVQLGASFGYQLGKRSLAGLKILNNFNKDYTSTAMNLYFQFDL